MNLINKHFKKGTFIGKIFNRNTIKLSYSCCPRIKARISSHNKKLLKNRGQPISEDKCNCRIKVNCPMKGLGPCNVGSVVYKAIMTAEGANEVKSYIGSTNNFKIRYGRHKQSFNDPNLRTDTALSEFCWRWKDRGLTPKFRFEVICKAAEYNTKSKKCFLCIKEKIAILKAQEDPDNINSKSELVGHCLHRDKSLLSSLNLRGYRPPDIVFLDTGQRPPDIEQDTSDINGSLSQEEDYDSQHTTMNDTNISHLNVTNISHLDMNNVETEQEYMLTRPTILRSGRIWR